jgi:GNAT superfamily N-acetyltransferase
MVPGRAVSFRFTRFELPITLRPAASADIPAMAAIRAQEWGTTSFWAHRIGSYLRGEHSPQEALPARAAFVATDESILLGFVAGHRTRRLGCDGELQWINVVHEKRGLGIGRKLLRQMGAWFVEQNAYRICVNVDPKNAIARKLYARYGAHPLKKHWMVWQNSRAMCRER